MNNFRVKTDVVFGEGSLDYLNRYSGKNVFVVTDSFMEKSGTVNKITNRINSSNITVFSEVIPDPPIELVVNGMSALAKSNAEVIVALGGGSSIDAAKAIMDFSKKALQLKDVTFVAIPTTSGTGSEVTSFSVITDKQKGIKYPLVSDDLLPDIAILDPELVKTAPDFITADTGMDVITHALEAYVSNKASDFSDACAEKALILSFKYLPIAYKDGNNIEAREKMHNASCLAGIAFNAASLGLNHSIAHIVGAKFHIPHGRTNAMLLPIIIDFNADITGYDANSYTIAAKKYCNIAKLLGLPSNNVRMGVKNLINEIKKIEKQMKLPTSLKDCGAEMEKYRTLRDEMAEIALKDACTVTNPRVASKDDVIRLIEKLRG